MKRLLYILIFGLLGLVDAAAQTIGRLPTDTNTLSLQVRNGDKIAVFVRHLFYKDEEGDTVPTSDSYILEVVNGDYPVIVDGIYGGDLSFQLSTIGETNGQDLLVFYHAGGSQFGVKIYTIDGVDVRPLKTQPVSSNMGYVRFRGKDIVVENQELNLDDSTTLYTDTYQVVDDECKLLREDKNILPPATKN